MPGPIARMGRRALLKYRARIDRFKLATRKHVRERLMDDDVIAEAVRLHAEEQGTPQHDAWRRVHSYIREIVPFFNVVAFFIGTYVNSVTKKKRLAALRKRYQDENRGAGRPDEGYGGPKY